VATLLAKKYSANPEASVKEIQPINKGIYRFMLLDIAAAWSFAPPEGGATTLP
jgi:hypothetical protein